jgi:tripartite-type tricarboxylate transporter receptor subunit TctC
MTIGPLRQGVEVKPNARTCTLLSALVLAAAALQVHAQAWTNKPIRILNPFPAGGGTDTFARPLAAKLSQSLGQSVFIENQGGGGGTIGAGNAARAAPDGYTFFMGAIHHTIAESVYTKLPYGIQMVHIPYRGAGPMMQDFLAGMVDVVFDEMGTSAAQIKGGKLRGLAVATPTRLASFPDIPTMDESGVPRMVVSTWYALWAVKGTPKEIVDKFYAETVKVLDQKDIKDIWANAASDVGGMPPDQFGLFVNREIARWAKVVKDAGVKLDP